MKPQWNTFKQKCFNKLSALINERLNERAESAAQSPIIIVIKIRLQ